MLKYIARRALYMVIMIALVSVFAFVLINLLHGQYLTWMRGIVLRGDFGHSFQFNRPIGELIAVRLPFSVVLSSATLLFTFAMAIPIGIYVATHQYSVGDYSATVFGFLGLATPNFLLALVLMLVDLLGHLIVPVVVIGTAGTSRWRRSLCHVSCHWGAV